MTLAQSAWAALTAALLFLAAFLFGIGEPDPGWMALIVATVGYCVLMAMILWDARGAGAHDAGTSATPGG